jgi:hypothetical protein
MKEQITEQKKEMAIAKAQITRMKREKTEIEEGNEVLRTALAVKTFEQSELQNKLKEQNELNEQRPYFHRTPSTAKIRRRNVELWAAPFQALLNEKFDTDASEARLATLRYCIAEENTALGDDELVDNTLTDRRVYYALEKLAGHKVGREQALKMALEVLPQGTLMDALPPTLIMEIVGRAEQDLASAIQAEYDVETCLNLKFKNSLSVRQWNRSRLLLACSLDNEGVWVRKRVGTTKVTMPILPEHRMLLNMQRAIEDEFGIRLDGTGDGNSCSISLLLAVAEDLLYNLRLGELVVTDDGKVVTRLGETPQIQLKMDACRAMSKIQQTSIAYTFPNVGDPGGRLAQLSLQHDRGVRLRRR